MEMTLSQGKRICPSQFRASSKISPKGGKTTVQMAGIKRKGRKGTTPEANPLGYRLREIGLEFLRMLGDTLFDQEFVLQQMRFVGNTRANNKFWNEYLKSPDPEDDSKRVETYTWGDIRPFHRKQSTKDAALREPAWARTNARGSLALWERDEKKPPLRRNPNPDIGLNQLTLKPCLYKESEAPESWSGCFHIRHYGDLIALVEQEKHMDEHPTFPHMKDPRSKQKNDKTYHMHHCHWAN